MATVPVPVKPRVLIIDDVLDNIEVLGEILTGDYIVQFATSGNAGLALLHKQLPDLILLDVMMPEIDGYDVCRRLKADPMTPDIPVIFVTAKNEIEDEELGLSLGAVDYITKPFCKAIVYSRINTHIALRLRELELRQLNMNLEQRVLERTQALRDALTRAETANIAKSTFLHNMNHEIRTPLNAVLGFSSILQQTTTDAVVRQRLDKIQKSGKQLLEVISGILDLSQIQANKFKIEQVAFNLALVVNHTFGVMRHKADAKELVLQWENDPDLPPLLYGDPLRIGQILQNYLDNAIKFSTSGYITCRTRRVRTWDADLRLRLEIEDHGIGIDPSLQLGLFNAFEQLDSSSTRDHGGTGLGLALNKHLAALMGGEVGVTSSPGQGSLFWATVTLVHETASSKQPEGISRQQALQLTAYLRKLLTDCNMDAVTLWHISKTIMSPILGTASASMQQAMANYDLESAQIILQQAMDDAHEAVS